MGGCDRELAGPAESMMHRSTTRSVLVLLLFLAAVIFLVSEQYWEHEFSSEDSGSPQDSRAHDTVPEHAEEPNSGAASARAMRPNLVTHVDGVPVWELPQEQRPAYFAELRALADAGWAEAMLALASEAGLCVLRQGMDEGVVYVAAHPDYAYIYLGAELETAEEREAAMPERWAHFEQRMEEYRSNRETCDIVLGEDPDVIMDWLEHALVQQHPGFFRALIEDRIVPFSPGWVVRNAERLAIFNQGFLDALTARVERGDREALAVAWKAWAGRRFLPEPDAERALVYGLAARRLPPPWNEHAPDDAQLAEIAGADFGPRQRQAARQAADELWRRCCADVMKRPGAKDASLD